LAVHTRNLLPRELVPARNATLPPIDSSPEDRRVGTGQFHDDRGGATSHRQLPRRRHLALTGDTVEYDRRPLAQLLLGY
jgi:hypothetical protein